VEPPRVIVPVELSYIIGFVPPVRLPPTDTGFTINAPDRELVTGDPQVPVTMQ